MCGVRLAIGTTLPCDFCVLASGSSYAEPIKGPQSPPRPAPSAPESRRADLRRAAEHLRRAASVCVVGGGTVGVELAAEVAARFGAAKRVTLVAAQPRLLDRMVPGCSAHALRWLEARGVTARPRPPARLSPLLPPLDPKRADTEHRVMLDMQYHTPKPLPSGASRPEGGGLGRRRPPRRLGRAQPGARRRAVPPQDLVRRGDLRRRRLLLRRGAGAPRGRVGGAARGALRRRGAGAGSWQRSPPPPPRPRHTATRPSLCRRKPAPAVATRRSCRRCRSRACRTSLPWETRRISGAGLCGWRCCVVPCTPPLAQPACAQPPGLRLASAPRGGAGQTNPQIITLPLPGRGVEKTALAADLTAELAARNIRAAASGRGDPLLPFPQARPPPPQSPRRPHAPASPLCGGTLQPTLAPGRPSRAQGACGGAAFVPTIQAVSLGPSDGAAQFNGLVLTGRAVAALKWVIERFQLGAAGGWRAPAAAWGVLEAANVLAGTVLFLTPEQKKRVAAGGGEEDDAGAGGAGGGAMVDPRKAP